MLVDRRFVAKRIATEYIMKRTQLFRVVLIAGMFQRPSSAEEREISREQLLDKLTDIDF